MMQCKVKKNCKTKMYGKTIHFQRVRIATSEDLNCKRTAVDPSTLSISRDVQHDLDEKDGSQQDVAYLIRLGLRLRHGKNYFCVLMLSSNFLTEFRLICKNTAKLWRTLDVREQSNEMTTDGQNLTGELVSTRVERRISLKLLKQHKRAQWL